MSAARYLRLIRTVCVTSCLPPVVYMSTTMPGQYWLTHYLLAWVAVSAALVGVVWTTEKLKEAHAAPASTT